MITSKPPQLNPPIVLKDGSTIKVLAFFLVCTCNCHDYTSNPNHSSNERMIDPVKTDLNRVLQQNNHSVMLYIRAKINAMGILCQKIDIKKLVDEKGGIKKNANIEDCTESTELLESKVRDSGYQSFSSNPYTLYRKKWHESWRKVKLPEKLPFIMPTQPRKHCVIL